MKIKLAKTETIHFVGIGGIGMSAIAEILHQKGFIVTGSDINDNLITKRLSGEGIAAQRLEIVRGFKESVEDFQKAILKTNLKKE